MLTALATLLLAPQGLPLDQVFVGSSGPATNDPWWVVDGNDGSTVSSGAVPAAANATGAAFTRGGHDLWVSSSHGMLSRLDRDTGAWTVETTLAAGAFGLEIDEARQRAMTFCSSSPNTFDLVDIDPSSATYGTVTGSADLAGFGLLERWGVRSDHTQVALAPVTFGGTVVLVDTDPSSPGYLSVQNSLPTFNIPSMAFGVGAAYDDSGNVVTVLLSGPYETILARYDQAAGAWIDHDPSTPFFDDHIVIPYGVGTDLVTLPGQNAMVCTGFGHSTQQSWVARIDFGSGNVTYWQSPAQQFPAAQGLSLSPDGSRCALLTGGEVVVLDTTTGAQLQSSTISATHAVVTAWGERGASLDLVCSPANPNSTGMPVTLGTSAFTPQAMVHLEATGGPANQFAYFVVSGAVGAGVPISQGVLCLAPPFARYTVSAVGPGLNSLGKFDSAGVLQNLVGTSSTGTGFDVPVNLPGPLGGTIQSGDTYVFQLWYRDQGSVSNFSDALSVSW